MPSTNQEQYLLELVNDARLDPLGDAARYLSSYVPLTASQQNIQFDLNYYGVSGAALQQAYAALTPTQPLAWNDSLATSARQHDQAMISADTQSHQEPGEPDFVTREENAGYALNGTAAENVYAYAQDPLFSHAAFMVDWGNATPGHRDNIMDPSLREVGIGMVPNTNSDPNFGPNVLTEDFGSRGTSGSFILGAAYDDLDHDGFYSVGEGLAGLTVSVAGVSTSSTSSGGYALQTSATGSQSVTLSGAGLAGTVSVGLTLNNANLKLDVVNGNTLRTSASATVSGPISRIEGLGTIGLSLTGNAGVQTIVGSLGADTLTGGGGKDTFAGTTAQLAGDTITDLAAGDIIVISDAVAAHFTYNLTGTTLDFDPNAAASQAFDAITLPTAGNLTFSVAADPTSGVDLFVNAPAPPPSAAPPLQNFGFAQGWGSLDNPRQIADVDRNGSADYVAFGADYTFVANGITGSDGQGSLGPAFASAAAVIKDFGTNEGYTAEAQRGTAATGAGVAATIYGQGFAGIYYYTATSSSSQQDAAGQPYSIPQYAGTPTLYSDFGTQQGWSVHNGFQILKTEQSDPYASVLGFGDNGIIVGAQAFAPNAVSGSTYLIPLAVGNADGWDQTTDIRTFEDNKGNALDFNHDGIADFLGMGPNGTVFAFGTVDQTGHYGLGTLQTATFGGTGTDLGRAQGWTDQTTARQVAHDSATGYADLIVFGNAGVSVAMGQDPSTHNGQPFGALHLALADFGTDQGWSAANTPRLIGDVNGDGTPDIVGFGANSTFVAIGSHDGAGNLNFTMDPTKQINDFGYNEGWDAHTVRALANVDGSARDSLVLSGAYNTMVYHLG